MRQTTSILHSQTGSSLIGAMMLVTVMLMSALALMTVGSAETNLVQRDVGVSQAFYLAESGAERGYTWFCAQTSPPTVEVAPFDAGTDTLAGGVYSVSIVEDPSAARPTYTISSTGTFEGRSRTVELDCGPTAFTDYLYYTNRDVGPGAHPWFYPGQVIDGPIYTNGYIGIVGDPVFTGDVYTGESGLMYYNNGMPIVSSALSNPPHDFPTFEGRVRCDAPDASWIAQADLASFRTSADIRLGGNFEILFGEHPGGGQAGYVSYRRLGQARWTHERIASTNGIIYVSGDCTVAGVLDGQVTVASVGQITIVDDLIYEDSDANGPAADCDDILGLVGGTRVVIEDNAANQNDCVVHAQIIAIENQASFVESYAQGSPRGTLSFYGGLGQDKWGPVGTGYIWDGELVILTGYDRDFHYDWRLRYMLPPGYENLVYANGVYRRLAWREVEPACAEEAL
jgi:hypothetical protein